VVESISIPKPPTSSPSTLPLTRPVSANSHGAASTSLMMNGPWRVPSSLARYWTPRSLDSGRASARHCAIRRIAFGLVSTLQKKLFAERRISRPPRSR
jgi:hypothetical protein